ncbi:MAG: DUF1294 domain-containing protein [Oscillospiraceae bacterium]
MNLKFFLAYMAMVSLIAVFTTISDKKRATMHKYRISEKTLIIVSMLGGSVAMLITMKLVKHKTKHKKFMFGIPIIIIIQIVLLVYTIWKIGIIC